MPNVGITQLSIGRRCIGVLLSGGLWDTELYGVMDCILDFDINRAENIFEWALPTTVSFVYYLK